MTRMPHVLPELAARLLAEAARPSLRLALPEFDAERDAPFDAPQRRPADALVLEADGSFTELRD